MKICQYPIKKKFAIFSFFISVSLALILSPSILACDTYTIPYLDTIICEYCPDGYEFCRWDWDVSGCGSDYSPGSYELEGEDCYPCDDGSQVCIPYCTQVNSSYDPTCPAGEFCITFSAKAGSYCSDGGGGGPSCTVEECIEQGYSGTVTTVCSGEGSSCANPLGSFSVQSDVCSNQQCDCCGLSQSASVCPDGSCDGDETCSTCPADCGVCSVGHIRIQGPNGIIKLNLISAADAIAANRGTVKVARFNGDINSAAELVPVTDPKASPVRIKTQQGIFSWAELP